MSSFNEVLVQRTASEANDLFGAVVAVVDRSGKIIDSTAAGRQSWTQDGTPTEDTTFWVYSFTKLLTTIAVLQCVERNQVNLDDPVESLVPELKDPTIIRPGPDDHRSDFTLTPATKKITLRHLLTHTSGIAYDARQPVLLDWRQSRGEGPLTMCGDVIRAYSTPLLFEPGESWVYGGSMDWAGVVVERLHGQTLGEYMDIHLFRPLGMDSTTFHPNRRPEIQQRIMDTALRDPEGRLVPFPVWYPAGAATDSGGMGAVSSMRDFIKVLGDLLQDRPILLKASTRDLMFEPQFDPWSPLAQALLDSGDMHENLTGGEKALGKLSFGLGGLLTVEETPNHPAGTLTWGGMPNLVWFVNTQKGRGAVYGSQIMMPNDPPSTTLVSALAQHVWNDT